MLKMTKEIYAFLKNSLPEALSAESLNEVLDSLAIWIEKNGVGVDAEENLNEIGVEAQNIYDSLYLLNAKKNMGQKNSTEIKVEDIENALFSPIRVGPTIVRRDKRRNIAFFGARCVVTVNPDTGMLVRVHPREG